MGLFLKAGILCLGLFLLSGCVSLEFLKADTDYPLAGTEKRERGEAIADQLVKIGKPDAAIPIYQRLLSSLTEVDRGRLLVKLGQAQYQAGHFEPAIQSFLAAREVKSDICTVDTGMAKSLLAIGEASLATVRYENCLTIAPENTNAQEGWALAAVISREDSDALELLEKFAAGHPEDIRRQNNYALALILMGNFRKSQQHLEKYAYSIDGAYALRQNLALVLALSGDEAGARYVALLDLPPDQAESNLRYYRRLRYGQNKSALKSVLLGVSMVK